MRSGHAFSCRRSNNDGYLGEEKHVGPSQQHGDKSWGHLADLKLSLCGTET